MIYSKSPHVPPLLNNIQKSIRFAEIHIVQATALGYEIELVIVPRNKNKL